MASCCGTRNAGVSSTKEDRKTKESEKGFTHIQRGREDPEEEHKAHGDVRLGPPGRRERGADVRDLRPVCEAQASAQ
jgi:hypothetical protein